MATDVGSSPYTYYSAPLRHSSLVCYTRGNFTSSVHRRPEVAQSPLRRKDVCASHTISREPSRAGNSTPPLTPARNVSASDYSHHVQRHYPQMFGDPLAILMRQQNARAILHINNAMQNIQADMIQFTDKVFANIRSRCVCCSARSFTDCPVRDECESFDRHLHRYSPIVAASNRDPEAPSGLNAQFRTPSCHKIAGRRLDMSDPEVTR